MSSFDKEKKNVDTHCTLVLRLFPFTFGRRQKPVIISPASPCRWLLKCTIMGSILYTQQSLKMIN